jgi:hypothetical protein
MLAGQNYDQRLINDCMLANDDFANLRPYSLYQFLKLI